MKKIFFLLLIFYSSVAFCQWNEVQNSVYPWWKTIGNSGLTSPATPATYGTTTIAGTEHWIGTIDAKDFTIGTNNIERMRVKNTTGYVGIGTATPVLPLEVSSGASANAIYGHSNNVGGYVGYEVNISFGNPVQTLNGAGVYATNPTAGYTSIYAQSSGAATVAAQVNYSSVWMANYSYVDNSSTVYNPAASYNQLNVTGATLGGTQIALRGWNERGTTAGNPGYSVGIQGIADAQNQDAMAIQGITFSSGTIRVGGYFEGLSYPGVSQAYAYVGGTTNGGTTLRKIVGTGTVAEIVPTPNHGRVTLICPESPEYWYTDYGSINMIDGFAHVDVDPILADIVFVNEKNPMRVFCTPVNMPEFNGVTITNQTDKSFDILELNGGKHSGRIDYEIVLKPRTNYGEGRFIQAPGPAWLKQDKEPKSAKAANQPGNRDYFHWEEDWKVYNYNPEDMVEVGDVIPAGPHAGKIKLANGKYGIGLSAGRP